MKDVLFLMFLLMLRKWNTPWNVLNSKGLVALIIFYQSTLDTVDKSVRTDFARCTTVSVI